MKMLSKAKKLLLSQHKWVTKNYSHSGVQKIISFVLSVLIPKEIFQLLKSNHKTPSYKVLKKKVNIKLCLNQGRLK